MQYRVGHAGLAGSAEALVEVVQGSQRAGQAPNRRAVAQRPCLFGAPPALLPQDLYTLALGSHRGAVRPADGTVQLQVPALGALTAAHLQSFGDPLPGDLVLACTGDQDPFVVVELVPQNPDHLERREYFLAARILDQCRLRVPDYAVVGV
ncbi:hypothetical protein OG900_06745 [Streptomyces sp. NBC_00433]